MFSVVDMILTVLRSKYVFFLGIGVLLIIAYFYTKNLQLQLRVKDEEIERLNTSVQIQRGTIAKYKKIISTATDNISMLQESCKAHESELEELLKKHKSISAYYRKKLKECKPVKCTDKEKKCPVLPNSDHAVTTINKEISSL